MNSIKILFADLWRFFKFRLLLLLILMVLVGLVEGLAITLLIPFFTLFGIGSKAADGGFLVELLSATEATFGGGEFVILFVISFVALLQGVLVITQGWLMSQMTQSYAAGWKARLFRSFVYAEWVYLADQKAGDLISSITNETGRLQAAAMNFFGLASTSAVTVIYIGYGLGISPGLTVLIIAASTALMALLVGFYKVSSSTGRRIGPLLSLQQILITEYLQGIRAVKSNVMEQNVLRQVEGVIQKLEKVNRTAAFIPHVVRGVFESVGLIFLILTMSLALSLGELQIAVVLVVMALFVRLYPRLSSLQQYVHSLNAFAPSVVNLISTVERAENNAEQYWHGVHYRAQDSKKMPLVIQNLNVDIAERPILQNINLSIRNPGLTVVTGPSGAGKSTLLSTIMKLIPYKGRIEFEGNLINEVNTFSWRKSVGFVPQEQILFNLTIKENICISNPLAELEDVVMAARKAQIHDFIESLPNGYDTEVGDQGVRLSGGQKQRIGIARALLSCPSLLLLDEPTTALDLKTGQALHEVIQRLKTEVAIIIVSHQREDCKIADDIVVLENGKLVDQGLLSELSKRSTGLFVD